MLKLNGCFLLQRLGMTGLVLRSSNASRKLALSIDYCVATNFTANVTLGWVKADNGPILAGHGLSAYDPGCVKTHTLEKCRK